MTAPAPRAWLGLRALFVLLGFLVLLIAGGGLLLFRVYDNQLIRQTESELIAQGTTVAAAFKQAMLDRLAKPVAGDAPTPLAGYGNEVAEPFRARHDPEERYHPHPATLALDDEAVRPRAEPARPPAEPADPVAAAAGASLLPILQETKQTTLAGLRVVDFRGTVVASSGQELGQSLAHREEIRRALQGEITSLLRKRVSDEPAPPYSSLSRETGVRVFVALPVVAGGRVLGAVVLSRTPMTLGKAFYQDRKSLLYMALILIAAVLLVSLFAAALIVRPVRALIRQTQAIAAGQGDGTAALAHAGTHEIAQLSQAFAHMATRLRERAAYIQGFAASVSHEFKTPLTAMQGTAELLRDHGAEMAPGERERFFADLVADTERLGRLVHRVLELARADMLEPGDEVTSPGEVMAAVAEGCRQAGMTVVTAGLERGGLIRMNAQTLETILRQLAENARVHGGTGVALTLALDWQAAPPAAVIAVADDGPGISPANRGRIFEPFFTTNRDHGGTGMGLHIARALLHSHGGAIELLPSEKGARFRLTIPA